MHIPLKVMLVPENSRLPSRQFPHTVYLGVMLDHLAMSVTFEAFLGPVIILPTHMSGSDLIVGRYLEV